MPTTGTGSGTTGGWTPPSVEEVQKLLPQYEIESILGRGGMGAVYKGKQASLGRPVAIKVLPETLATGFDGEVDAHQYVERFKLEARSMANLDHPAIISVYDFGQTEAGHLYFVMEFIDGMDIEQYIEASGGKVDPEHAVAIVSHVLDALGYAHSKGIVHRDIKPANVLLNREGRIKIADFGLAKEFVGEDEDGSELTGLTMSNMAMGTPDYIAPEALDSDAVPDHRADLYAVGVMLYRMLTGKLPRGIFKLPSEVNEQLDPRFDEMISLGMAGSPDERFQSASEFRSKLGEMLSQPVAKVEAGQDSQAVQAVVTKSKLKFPAAAAAASRSQALSRSGSVAPAASKAPMIGGVVAVCLIVGAVLFFVLRESPQPSVTDTGGEGTASVSNQPERVPVEIDQPSGRADDITLSSGAGAAVAKSMPESDSASVTAPAANANANSNVQQPVSIDGEWRSIFDGQSLTGWRLENSGTASVDVVDGAIVARGTKGYLIYEGAEFEDFELVMEVKTTANMNSGVFLHVSNEKTLTAFPEVQIANGPRSDRSGLWTGGIWKGARVDQAPAKDGEWFELRISVLGKVVTSAVNGTQLVRQDLDEVPIPGVSTGKGGLAFQITDRTGEGGTVSFRNIRVRSPGSELNVATTSATAAGDGTVAAGTGTNTSTQGLQIPENAPLQREMLKYRRARKEKIGSLVGFYRNALQKERTRTRAAQVDGVIAALDEFEIDVAQAFEAPNVLALPELKSVDGLPPKLSNYERVFLENLTTSEVEVLRALDISLENCEAEVTASELPTLREFRQAVIAYLAPPGSGLGVTAEMASNGAADDGDGWQVIFNGSDLSGWKLTGNGSGFEVSNGVLKAVASGSTPSHLFWTDEGSEPVRVKDFDLRLSARSVGSANSGIYFHASDVGLATSKFPRVGMELALDTGASGLTATGGLFKLAAPKVSFSDTADWFDLELEVRGLRVVCRINGEEVLDYTQSGPFQGFGTAAKARIQPDGGGFALQANSPDGEWHFKDIRLKVLQ